MPIRPEHLPDPRNVRSWYRPTWAATTLDRVGSAPPDAAMSLAAALTSRFGCERSEHVSPTGITGLDAVVSAETSPLTATLYHPVVCLILQGAKELALGAEGCRVLPGGGEPQPAASVPNHRGISR